MNSKEICQYCFNPFDKDKHKKTKEHIFPKGVIDLYPEQYIVFSKEKSFVSTSGTTILDVCRHCNNTLLGVLDSYGKNLIRTQFYKEIPFNEKNTEHQKNLDFHLLSRWLLKIFYNHLRSIKADAKWFANSHEYLLHELLDEKLSFSLFAGVHINTSPLPEDFYNYLPLQINEEPRIMGNSFCVLTFGLDPMINSIKILGANNTFCIRLGIAIFYCILWDKNTEHITKCFYETLFTEEFNFVKIESLNSEYTLKCVSAHTNIVLGYNHLVSKSGLAMDEKAVLSYSNGNEPHESQQIFKQLIGEEHIKNTRAMIESDMFPDNKMLAEKYRKLIEN